MKIKKKTLWFSLIVFFLIIIQSQPVQGQNYNVSLIPDSLRQGSGAVIRESVMDIRVFSPRKVVVAQKLVITVFTEADDHYIKFRESYSSFVKFRKLKAYIYNESGDFERQTELSGFKDQGDYSNDNLFSEIRYKSLYPAFPRFPYTVEYEWEIEYNGTLNLPIFSPLRTLDLPVQYACLTMDYSTTDSVRIKELNLPVSSSISRKNDKLHYKLELKDLKGVPDEAFHPQRITFLPTVIIVPSRFEMDGTEGSFQSWQSFGAWSYSLSVDLDGLSSETIDKIKMLTRSGTRAEKIRAVYKYMQSRTRYVSITLGLGGWKPASPAVVDKLGYGDCKALTEYTRALLKVAGIESFYTLVYSGSNLPVLFKDFPYNCFNHAILCIPDKKDTTWLECTSPWFPAGFLSSSVLNRPALMIRKSGGILVRTPAGNQTESVLQHTGTIRLDSAGNGFANIVNWYGGTFYADRLQFITNSVQDNKTQLLKEISLNTINLKQFSYVDYRDSILLIRENIGYELAGYAAGTQNSLIFSPAFLSAQRSNPFSKKNRISPIEFPLNYTVSDSLHFEIPPGYIVKNLPAEVDMETPFGRFQTRYTEKNGSVVYYRALKIKSGLWYAADYPGIQQFVRRIASADKEKIIFEQRYNVKE